MKNQWLVIIISGIISGCTATAQNLPPPPNLPPSQLKPPATGQATEKKSLRLKLQIRDLDHLLVKEGDKIKEGQVVADQIDDRQRLTSQKLEVQESLKRIENGLILEPIAPVKIPELAPLPSPVYMAEEAAIIRAKRNLTRLADKVALQQKMLDLLSTKVGTPPEIIEHETVKLAEAIAEHDTAAADLDLAEGKLLKAQADYQQLEYQHSVNSAQAIEQQSRAAQIYQQQLLESANQLRNKESQLSQLRLQLQSIDEKLSLLAQIKSPYDATIRKIQIIDQVGNFINIELVLSSNKPVLRNQPPITPED